MRRFLLGMGALALFAMPVSAQTAEEIIAKYIQTVGGVEKIQAVKTLRRTGKFTGGGGFQAVIVEESTRPGMVRQEFTYQGMTGVVAYDGKKGWKIEPWQGKKEPEALSEEESKQVVDDADFDGPLVNYKQKGHKVEFVGMEPVEGTDTFKLKMTLANGDVRYYFMDTDYYVPIKVETKRMVRGSEREYETVLGDYKAVAGWYLPHSIESSSKGSPYKQQVTYEKIEANMPIEAARFREPVVSTKQPDKQPDASTTPPKPTEGEKPPAKPAKKEGN